MKRAAKICVVPGCNAVVLYGSRCPAHREVFHQQSYRAWYQTDRWRLIRAEQLLREPWCSECAARGEQVQATDVDHILPHRGDREAFFEGPFQSLCHSCHSRKTNREISMRGKG